MHSNGEVDRLGKCSILDRIVMPHSHHSRRLSLKKASYKKGLTGYDNHASLFLSLCVWNVFGSQRSGGYIRRNLPSYCKVSKLTISCVLQVGLLNLTRK